jgi:hypothetical protein
MEPHCPKYAMNGHDAKFDFNDMVTEYFATSITPEGILLSEDYHFCRKYRELGGEVYAAPWVQVQHAGDYIFSGSFAATMDLLSQTGSSQSLDATDDHSE